MGHIGIGGAPKSSGGGGASNVTVDYVKGYVDANNSSTTPLAGNGVFTGTAFDVTNFSSINVNVFSDVPSATNGVAVQFSTNGTNWDHAHSTSYLGTSGVGYIFNAEFKYARVVYTNGSSAQATFRLQTIFKPTRVQSSLLRLNQNPTENYFAELTKSVIIGRSSAGGTTYVDVKVNPSGSLTTAIGDITGIVGQNTMANSVPVTLASDQTAILFSPAKAAAATLSNISASASSVTLVSLNASRLGATIYNDSSATLYLKLGSTASSSSFTVKLYQDDYFELSGPHIYTGIITGIWDSATGNARITELT